MKRHLLDMLFGFILSAGLAVPVTAEDSTRYERLLQAPIASSTVFSYANALLVLPQERDSIEEQLSQRWWANNQELSMQAAQRTLLASEFKHQLDEAEQAVRKHEIRRLVLAGFTQVGTVQNLDLYYAGSSLSGPIIFRVSIAFRPDAEPLLFGIRVFAGFEEARDAIAAIQHLAGDRTASITLDQEPASTMDSETKDN